MTLLDEETNSTPLEDIVLTTLEEDFSPALLEDTVSLFERASELTKSVCEEYSIAELDSGILLDQEKSSKEELMLSTSAVNSLGAAEFELSSQAQRKSNKKTLQARTLFITSTSREKLEITSN